MATDDSTVAPTPPATPSTTPPARGAGRALAITGIALGAVLTLGLTFAGGIALGHALTGGPGDRGPQSSDAGAAPGGPSDERGERGERIGERIEQRMDERMDERMNERREQREEFREERRELFEQWLQEQGIDPRELPAPPSAP